MSFAGSNIEAIVKKLLEGMKVDPITPFDLTENVGKLAKARKDVAPPRVTFVPLYDDAYRAPHQQPDDGHAHSETTTFYEVKCWGADETQATQLRDCVLRQCKLLFSSDAYKTQGRGLHSDGSAQKEKGNTTTFTLGFVIPLYQEIYLRGRIRTATTTIVETDPDGSNPEEIT